MSALQTVHEVALMLIGPARFAQVMNEGFIQAWRSRRVKWQRRRFEQWANEPKTLEMGTYVLSKSICAKVPGALHSGKMDNIYDELTKLYATFLLQQFKEHRPKDPC